MLQTFDRCPAAVIAVCEGGVMGGGFGLACVADVTLAAGGARFRLPETRLGGSPAQIAPFVVRRVGLSHARRLAVTGATVSAEEAVAISLAHRRVEGDPDVVVAEVVAPVAAELDRRGTPFSGLLYAGLALTSSGPAVIEFNCRFGDPETQALVRRLQNDLVPYLLAASKGELEGTESPDWRDETPESRQKFYDAVRGILIASVSQAELNEIAMRLCDALTGVGILQAFLRLPGVEEIYVRGGRVAMERSGRLEHLGDGGRWLFFTAAPIKTSEGAIIGAIETLWDNTENKQAEVERHKYTRRIEESQRS